MKQIHQFANSIFGHLNKKLSKELQADTRSHLLKSVVALKESGFTEQEAYTTAINKFKDNHKSALKKGKHEKIMMQSLLGFALVFLLVAVIVSISLLMRDNTYRETFELMDIIVQPYQSKSDFTSGDERAIQEIVERNSKWFDNISYFAFIKATGTDENITKEKLITQGKVGIGESDMMRLGYTGTENIHWYVEWEFIEYDYLGNVFLYYIFFVISGVFFIIWWIVRSANRKRLKEFVSFLG